MADVKALTRQLIQELNEVARWSEEAGEELEKFSGILEKFSGESTHFLPGMKGIVNIVNDMSLAMRELGFSDQYINKTRVALMNYAAEYGNLANIQGKLSRMPKGDATGTGLLARLGPLRDARRAATIQAGRQEAADLARMVADIPIADIAAAGGDIQRIITLRREYFAHLESEKQVLHEIALVENKLINQAIERRNIVQEMQALQDAARTMGAGVGRGVAVAPGIPEKILPPVTEVEGSIKRITEHFEDFIPGGQVGIDNFIGKMKDWEIETAKVTYAHEDLSSGIKTFSFRVDRGGSAVATATLHMDQWGNVLKDTGNKFRTFSSAIGRNLLKVLQWGIATGFVYGIIQQLSGAMKQITELETKLADVQVALGKSTGDLNVIFKEAAIIADLTSQSLTGVVESYALAFQAAGGMEDPLIRSAKANALLRESMILSALSGLEQAKAMDTLIGALRQTGRELDDGRELLDKWVAVSRESNVSVATMAETYAIVGAQAKDLGLEFEQLNALAATLAEATPLSATEVGNALRGIMAGFQTSQAEKVLNRFTIETREASGELKNFWSLLEEISMLIASGALSPAEITEISNAIGGGYRRGGQVQVILRGMARSQQLVNVQWDAGGQAVDALEIKMATLQAAITRLGNAFGQFAQTLGEEGGVLDIARFLVEAFTLFVGVIDDLVAGLGKATPYLLSFAAAYAVLNTQQMAGLMGKPAGGLLAGITGIMGPPQAGGQMALPGMAPSRMQALSGARAGLTSKMRGVDPLAAGIALGVPALTAIQAAGAATDEEQTEGFIRAGGQFVGAVIGGLIGSATIVGAPVGAAIGAAMGGAFADSVTDTDIGARIAETFVAESRKKDIEAGVIPPTIEELIPEGDEIIANIMAFFGNITELLVPGKQWEHVERPAGERFVTGDDVIINILKGNIDTKLAEGLFSQEAADVLKDLIDAAYKEGLEEGDLSGAFRQLIEKSTPEMERAAGPIVAAFLEKMRREFVLGDIGLGELIDISKEITAPRIATDVATLKETLSLVGIDVGTNELIQTYLDLDDTVQVLLLSAQQLAVAEDLLTFVREEATKATEEYRSAIEGGATEGEKAKTAAGDYRKVIEGVTEAEKARNDAMQNLTSTYETLTRAQRVSSVQQVQIVDVGKLTPAQVQAGVTLAQQLTYAEKIALAEGQEEVARDLTDALTPLMIKSGEGIGAIYGETIGRTTSEHLMEAFDILGFETEIKEQLFQLRDMREQLGQADYPALMRRYGQAKATITAQFPEYELQEDTVGLILKDGFREFHGDMTILNLAMQDLIDINEQQLEGVWNIPAGMTAMVAITSLYRQVPGGGGGGTSFEELFNQMVEAQEEAEPGTIASLEAQLEELNLTIADYQGALELGPKETGIREHISLQADLVDLTAQRDDLLQQIAMTQMGQGLGMAAQGDVSIVDQLREALTIQNKIELNANIRLVVDGRTLANIVKQYLFEDLVGEASKSLGGGGGNYVVTPE
jgi:TP901 family phage tail tape measure protein